MAYRVCPIDDSLPYGALVLGLTASDIEDPATRSALYDLWIDKGLLVFSGTSGERDFQVELSQIFGELELHPVPEHRLAECPPLTRLHYDPGSGSVATVDGEDRGGYLPWHSDLVYVDRINRGGLLRPVTIPSSGGQTCFNDQVTLYEALPDDLKARIDGLNVIYHTGAFDPKLKKFGKKVVVKRPIAVNEKNRDQYMAYPRVAHPMVYTQAETGRKILNVSPWFAEAIEGMETEEGDALLARIVDHCEDESRAYFHRWQHGDMVLWDNWRMIHGAYGVPLDQHRTVERTTIKGDYSLGRIVSGTAVAREALVEV